MTHEYRFVLLCLPRPFPLRCLRPDRLLTGVGAGLTLGLMREIVLVELEGLGDVLGFLGCRPLNRMTKEGLVIFLGVMRLLHNSKKITQL